MINVNDKILNELTGTEYWVLTHLAKRMNKDRQCFPSLETIMEDTGMSKPTVIKNLKLLQKKGFVEKQGRTKKGSIVKMSSLYTIKTRLISFFTGSRIGTQQPSKNFLPTVVKKLYLSSKKTLPTVVKNFNLNSKEILLEVLTNIEVLINIEVLEIKKILEKNKITKKEQERLNNFFELGNEKSPAKKEKKKNILFRDSEIFLMEKFKAAFAKGKYSDADFEYYHEAVLNWSDGGGNKKIDWVATARGFMNRDKKEGKLATIKNKKNKGSRLASSISDWGGKKLPNHYK